MPADRALDGCRVAVLRPREQAVALEAALRTRGAVVHTCPLIRIEEPEDTAPLYEAAAGVARYSWVVLTSANAARRFSAALSVMGTAGAVDRVAVVGPATSAVARALGLPVRLVAERATGDGLADALIREGRAGVPGPMLFPRARDARRRLPERLRAAGVQLDEVECYRTVADEEGVDVLRDLLRRGECDVLAFTSPSQVEVFDARIGAALAAACDVAVIGPSTAAAARAAGLRVHVEAVRQTMGDLVDAICAHAPPRTE